MRYRRRNRICRRTMGGEMYLDKRVRSYHPADHAKPLKQVPEVLLVHLGHLPPPHSPPVLHSRNPLDHVLSIVLAEEERAEIASNLVGGPEVQEPQQWPQDLASPLLCCLLHPQLCRSGYHTLAPVMALRHKPWIKKIIPESFPESYLMMSVSRKAKRRSRQVWSTA